MVDGWDRSPHLAVHPYKRGSRHNKIGMVIMQRPQGNAKFKTKEELNKFMAMKYIENVWCFGPKDYDFFSSSRRATLESFL